MRRAKSIKYEKNVVTAALKVKTSSIISTVGNAHHKRIIAVDE